MEASRSRPSVRVCVGAALSRTDTEWAGACFSPDGWTLFVNLYRPAKTVAITGPWIA